MSEVAIGFDENNIENSINNALKELDLADIVTGKVVAIKPNDTYATEDDKTGVTQGDTLQAVIRHVKKYNPKNRWLALKFVSRQQHYEVCSNRSRECS